MTDQNYITEHCDSSHLDKGSLVKPITFVHEKSKSDHISIEVIKLKPVK
jgi:hypothetical protein